MAFKTLETIDNVSLLTKLRKQSYPYKQRVENIDIAVYYIKFNPFF